MRCSLLALAVIAIGLPAIATASVGSDPEPLIYGGTPVDECAWPTTVSMGGSCTGTLVSPDLVFYAAHCGAGYNTVSMGERISPGHKRSVPTEFCMTNPAYQGNGSLGDGVDFAFCKLAQPVTDVPIVPILMGCETSILALGEMVTIVGFGQADNGPYGIKREVEVPIVQLGVEAWVGGQGKSSCSGDSGGPLYVRLREEIGGDGSWRVFGVTSWGQADNCPAGGSFGLMHLGVEWVEENSGVDVTPCHDADGTWNPSPYCRDFPLDPGTPHGDWNNGCSGGPIGGWSEICGAKPEGDDTPPTVTITAPMDQTTFESEGGQAAVEIIADAQDDGWGIKEVQLIINGNEVPNGADKSEPYAWPGAFNSGQYTVIARAVDLNDNVTDSEPVHFGVDMPPPEPESEDETDDGAEEGTGTGNPQDDGEEGGTSGCGCSSTSSTPGWTGLLLVGLLATRRRR